MKVLRQPLEVLAQADDPQERLGLARLHRSVPPASTVVSRNPRGLRRLGCRPDEAKLSVLAMPRRYGEKRSSPSTPRATLQHSAMLPSPPHCASRPRPAAARRKGAANSGRGRGSSGRSRSRRRVDRRVEVERRAGRTRTRARSRRREHLARQLDHRRRARRRRSPDRSGRRSNISSVTRPLPQPASRTVSSPRRSRRVKDLARPLLLRVGDAVVGAASQSPVLGAHREPSSPGPRLGAAGTPRRRRSPPRSAA